MAPTPEQLRAVLREIEDPELGLSIVDLGLVRDIHVSERFVQVAMTLTNPTCPHGPQLVRAVQQAVAKLSGPREPIVQMVWEPPWDVHTDATEEAKAELGIWI